MEEIRLTTWDAKYLINNVINYQPQLVTAGFQTHQQYESNWISFPANKRKKQKNFDTITTSDAITFHGTSQRRPSHRQWS